MWAVGCSMLTCGLLAFALTFATVNGRTYNLQTQGAVPNDPTLATANKNGAVFNSTLDLLVDGDTIVIPTGTFHMQGGIMSQNKVRISLEAVWLWSCAGGVCMACVWLVCITSTPIGLLPSLKVVDCLPFPYMMLPYQYQHQHSTSFSPTQAGITLMFDGTVVLADDIDAWPRSGEFGRGGGVRGVDWGDGVTAGCVCVVFGALQLLSTPLSPSPPPPSLPPPCRPFDQGTPRSCPRVHEVFKL
jgi:hypothetical protein